MNGPGLHSRIATDNGLDGPRSNPGGDETFRPSRPALRPTQPPYTLDTGISPWIEAAGVGADTPPPSSAEGPRKE